MSPPAGESSGLTPKRAGGRLRIVFHLNILQYGGLEKKVMHLALGLDPNRFEPIVTWSDRWGGVGDRLGAAGIAVPRLKLRERTLPEVVARLRQLDADIFHSFGCQKNDLDVRAASQAGVPVIVTNRGNVRHWDPEARLQPWETNRNRRTHAITACCDAVAWVCFHVERVPWSKIVVLYNGVAIPDGLQPANSIRDELGLAAGTMLLGYVANYRVVKAHEVLLRAFRKMLRVRPNAHLVCCGGDREGRGLPELAARLGLKPFVSMLDEREDVGAIYRGLDLYVHASRSEGLPNAVLEAMAYGLPVVATSAGGTPEAVEEGVTGCLVPPGDEGALSDAMIRLLSNEEERRRFGREGRERVMRKFALAGMIDAYSRFYERLAGRGEPAEDGAARAASR